MERPIRMMMLYDDMSLAGSAFDALGFSVFCIIPHRIEQGQ